MAKHIFLQCEWGDSTEEAEEVSQEESEEVLHPSQQEKYYDYIVWMPPQKYEMKLYSQNPPAKRIKLDQDFREYEIIDDDMYFIVQLEFRQKPIRFVIDSGSSTSVLSADRLEHYGIDVEDLDTADCDEDILGTIEAALKCPNNTTLLMHLEVDACASQNILGMDFLEKFCCKLHLDETRPVLEIQRPGGKNNKTLNCPRWQDDITVNNGHRIAGVVLDTGCPSSYISLKKAQECGLLLTPRSEISMMAFPFENRV